MARPPTAGGFLEPASPAVKTATSEKQHYDDDDQKSCVVHIVLPPMPQRKAAVGQFQQVDFFV
jgi:hypothetical protein